MEKLLKIYCVQKDAGRTIAYRKAIASIKTCPFQIIEADQIADIPNLGDKIKQKIKELLETGKIEKVEKIKSQDIMKAIDLLSKVWGVGPQTAELLYQKGIRTIHDLRQNQ